jgi:hypothetical protein
MGAYKGTKILGTMKGGTSPKGGTAPVASKLTTQGPRTTDPDMVGKPAAGRADPNDGYVYSGGIKYDEAVRLKRKAETDKAAAADATRKQATEDLARFLYGGPK